MISLAAEIIYHSRYSLEKKKRIVKHYLTCQYLRIFVYNFPFPRRFGRNTQKKSQKNLLIKFKNKNPQKLVRITIVIDTFKINKIKKYICIIIIIDIFHVTKKIYVTKI